MVGVHGRRGVGDRSNERPKCLPAAAAGLMAPVYARRLPRRCQWPRMQKGFTEFPFLGVSSKCFNGEAGNEKVAIRQDDRRRTSRQHRVCEEERTCHGVSEIGPHGPEGECYRVRRRVDRQDGAGRGERHGCPGRCGWREHRGLLDERSGGALGPRRGA